MPDRLAGADQRVRPLREQERPLGQLDALLLRVVAVVEADADDLLREVEHRATLCDISGVPSDKPVMDEAADTDLRRQYRQIYRYVRRRSRSDAEAEDVTQDVFVDAARALDRHVPGSPPTLAWLYTTAQRRLVDTARRSVRRREAGDETVLELIPAPASLYGHEVADAVARGLRALPPLQRDVVVMKLLEGRSFAEIAAATGAGEGACRMRFLRGLEQLRDTLEREGIGP